MMAKKPIQTKFRMPLLNWVALKPNQITGTVFTELNDEKVLQVSGPALLPVWAPEKGGTCLDHAGHWGWSPPLSHFMEAQEWGSS